MSIRVPATGQWFANVFDRWFDASLDRNLERNK